MASRVKRLVPVTIGDVLDGHLALDLDYLDRFYVRGYLARLQVGGRVVQFLEHRGYPVPSPACLQQMFNIIRASSSGMVAFAGNLPGLRAGGWLRLLSV